MYIPHGNYPQNNEGFNTIKALPNLFRNIEFRDFALTLKKRFNDFSASELFLYSSQYQQNYGAKLVMLISAIERVNGRWRSLDAVLKSKEFKKEIVQANNGEVAFKILDEKIKDYLNSFGSTRSVIDFYTKNLTKAEKLRIINGIHHTSNYRKEKPNNEFFEIMYIPENPKRVELNSIEEINKELAKRLKRVVYDIRNLFVHNAYYLPLPDKRYLKEHIAFQFDEYEDGGPKSLWTITMPFETLHKLTKNAFCRYWKKEYEREKTL